MMSISNRRQRTFALSIGFDGLFGGGRVSIATTHSSDFLTMKASRDFPILRAHENHWWRDNKIIWVFRVIRLGSCYLAQST